MYARGRVRGLNNGGSTVRSVLCLGGVDQNCDGVDGVAVCNNTCAYAFDLVCDDDGVGSTFDVCEFGSDCSDCGPRSPCTDTCTWSGDGECDDGGVGSINSVCDEGTDCTDCGPRP